LEEAGFGKLGFWAIAACYLSIAIGSPFTTWIMNRIGEIKCMALGSLINTPWILAFALCGYKKSNPQVKEFYTEVDFISFFIIVLSILNGFGQAIQWVG